MRVIFSWVVAAVALVLGLVVVAGGVALAQSAPAPGDALAGSEWRPTEIQAEAIDEATAIYIRFAGEGKVSGLSGCNRFFGSYKSEAASLTFSPLATTRKACPEPLMKLETRFLSTLEATRTFERDKTRLVLRNEAGEPMMRLAQTDWD